MFLVQIAKDETCKIKKLEAYQREGIHILMLESVVGIRFRIPY